MIQPNGGFILPTYEPSDYVFGGPISLKSKGFSGTVLQPNGDWTSFAPPGEPQHKESLDTLACATFTTLNGLEILMKRVHDLDLNFSERFVAKATDTDKKRGNDPKAVAQFVRKNWSVLEKDYPLVSSKDEYYQDIPQELFPLAQKYKGNKLFGYELVNPDPASLREALKLSPVGLSNALTEGEDGRYYKPHNWRDVHISTLLKIEADGTYVILDSYFPYIKRIHPNFKSEYAIRWELDAELYSLLTRLKYALRDLVALLTKGV